jgi:hypothetical protein
MKIIITEQKLNNLIIKWLDQEFGNLTPIKFKNGNTVYVDEENYPLFYYEDNSKVINIDNNKIWYLIKKIFNIERPEIKDVLSLWLEKTYNIVDLRPFPTSISDRKLELP